MMKIKKLGAMLAPLFVAGILTFTACTAPAAPAPTPAVPSPAPATPAPPPALETLHVGLKDFNDTAAEEEGYWYSRYNLGNLVMG